MSDVLAYLFSQTFALTGAQNWTVTDDAVTSAPINLNGTTGTRYYRIIAARTASAARTKADPGDLLYWVRAALGPTRWNVTMLPNGRVRITYLGTGAGVIDLTASTTVAFLLGFDSSIGSPVLNFATTNAYVDTPCIPTHTIAAAQFWPDSGWTRIPQRTAGVTLKDGNNAAWSDRKQGLARSGAIGMLPIDWEYAQGIEAGTPMFPVDTATEARLFTPSTGEPGQEGPWSVLDQLGNQLNQNWGCVFGTLVEVLAGSDTKFDVCSVTIESIRAEDSNRPAVAALDRRWVQSIAFRLVTKGTRS